VSFSLYNQYVNRYQIKGYYWLIALRVLSFALVDCLELKREAGAQVKDTDDVSK
jgi:hypothetical protein